MLADCVESLDEGFAKNDKRLCCGILHHPNPNNQNLAVQSKWREGTAQQASWAGNALAIEFEKEGRHIEKGVVDPVHDQKLKLSACDMELMIPVTETNTPKSP